MILGQISPDLIEWKLPRPVDCPTVAVQKYRITLWKFHSYTLLVKFPGIRVNQPHLAALLSGNHLRFGICLERAGALTHQLSCCPNIKQESEQSPVRLQGSQHHLSLSNSHDQKPQKNHRREVDLARGGLPMRPYRDSLLAPIQPIGSRLGLGLGVAKYCRRIQTIQY